MKITEFLDRQGIQWRQSGPHSKRGWIQMDCPRCGQGSQKFHMGFNLSFGYFNCWKCGRIRQDEVVSAYSIRVDAGMGSARFFQKFSSGLPSDAEDIPKGYSPPPGVGELKEPHKAYLEFERGFDPDRIQKLWQVGGVAMSTRCRWSLFIPIIHERRRVSWTTRSIQPGGKYISARAEEEAVRHKDVLYGLDYCFHSCVVVEGPLDAWRIGPGAAATFGVDFTFAQVAKLSRIPRRFILFDNSADAQRRAQELAESLAIFDGETHILELDAEDPGEASDSEVAWIRRRAGLS